MSLETPWDPSSRRALDARASTLLPVVCSGSGDGGIDASAASSCGPRHEVNEDASSPLAAGSNLYVVADGVGGGALASTASRELVTQLHAALDGRPVDADSVRRALRAADQRIASLIAERSAQAGAATVALCCPAGATPADWLIAWVGDCRVYRVAPGARRAELLSVDDTYDQLGEPVPSGGSGDDPARMVGNGAVGEPNTRSVRLEAGELLMLCSDGVHKHVEADEIALRLLAEAPLAERCSRLVSLARHRGSQDDATVLAVQRHFTPEAAAAVALATAPTLVLRASPAAGAAAGPHATSAAAPPAAPAAAPSSSLPAAPAQATPTADAPAAPRTSRGRWAWLLTGLALLAASAWLHLQPAESDDEAEPLPSVDAPAAEPAAPLAVPPAAVAASATAPAAAASRAVRSTPSMHVEGPSAPRRAASRPRAPAPRASAARSPKAPA